MSLSDRRPPACTSETWERFLEVLAAQGVKQQQWRWYAYRVEQYFKAVSGTRADQHTAADVAGYLEELGRSGGLEDWQYLQVVDALRVLFSEAARSPWSAEVDWAYWKDSARSLGRTHATVARETAPKLKLQPTPKQIASTSNSTKPPGVHYCSE